MGEATPKSASSGFVRNVSWYFLSAVGRFGAQFILGIVLARILTPSDYGVYAGAMVVVGFGTLLAQLGVSQALIQAKEISQAYASTAFSATLILSSVAAIVTYLSGNLAAQVFDIPELAPVVRGLALIFFLMGVSSVFVAMLDRQLRFREIAVFRVVGYGLAGVASITCALNGFGVWSLVVQSYAQYSIILALILWRTDVRFRIGWDAASARSMLSFGGHVTLAGYFNHFALQADNFIAGRFLGQSALGLYSVAYQLMQLPHAYVSSVVSRVFFPTAAQLGSGRKAADFHLKTVGAVSLALVPIVTIFVLQADVMIVAIYGAKWAKAGAVLQILASALIFRSVYSLNGDALKALGVVRPLTYATAAYALSVCVMAYWGAKFGGVAGIAATVCVAITLYWLITTLVHKRAAHLSIRELASVHTPWILALGSSLCLGWGAQKVMQGALHPVLLFGIIGIITVSCVGAVLAFLPNSTVEFLRSRLIQLLSTKRKRSTF